ncbi:MAG: HTTM domain-containing protein [Leptolyngbya sp. SIO1E4]|nr:HTTM domain-containing protein [Leptolyngbya sp. SIO1E4]
MAFLVYFRIAFGGIMLWEVQRYFHHGWIQKYWMDPVFNFTYPGFGWVQPWPGQGMIWHFVALGVLATFIALGFFYRVSALLFCLGFTYIFLLEQARYLNHFYLICLLSFILICLPAHRLCSVDVLRRPQLLSQTAPAWTLWLLRFQLGVAYFYGGIAKLNGDWLQGEPMRMWLAKSTDFPLVGQFFTQEWMVYLLSYSGLFLDLLVVPLLLWRKTRWLAFTFAVLFHLTNARLFSIGIFPWFMIAATAIFFPPDWPRRVIGFLAGSLFKRPLTPVSPSSSHPSMLAGLHTVSRHSWRVRGANPGSDRPPTPPGREIAKSGSARAIAPSRDRALIATCLLIYASLQCLLPLRHYLYPNNVSWTEEGHRFAWHMKLRDKDATAEFIVRDPATQEVQVVLPKQFLARWQARKMSTRPDMVLQFAHYLAETLPAQGPEPLEVRTRVWASLNGRPPRLLIDPFVDLVQQSRSLYPADWILPLNDPLKPEA